MFGLGAGHSTARCYFAIASDKLAVAGSSWWLQARAPACAASPAVAAAAAAAASGST